MRLFCKVLFIFFIQLNILSQHIISQDCKITNKAFQVGEKLTYIVSYDWFVIWTDMGEVNFQVKGAKAGNIDLYHLYGTGRTFPQWDSFFKVRDIYQSWIDTETLNPLLFKRNVNEGGYHIHIKYKYNWKDSLIYSLTEKTNKPLTNDTIPIIPCLHNVISAVYYTRNIDYSIYEENDSIPITIILDNEIEALSYFYKGKEEIKLKKLGKFNCLKFEVGLVEGSIFKKGDTMKIWVTDDDNHIPLLVESPIIVGSVKVRLVSMKGVKNKLTSKIRN